MEDDEIPYEIGSVEEVGDSSIVGKTIERFIVPIRNELSNKEEHTYDDA